MGSRGSRVFYNLLTVREVTDAGGCPTPGEVPDRVGPYVGSPVAFFRVKSVAETSQDPRKPEASPVSEDASTRAGSAAQFDARQQRVMAVSQ